MSKNANLYRPTPRGDRYLVHMMPHQLRSGILLSGSAASVVARYKIEQVSPAIKVGFEVGTEIAFDRHQAIQLKPGWVYGIPADEELWIVDAEAIFATFDGDPCEPEIEIDIAKQVPNNPRSN